MQLAVPHPPDGRAREPTKSRQQWKNRNRLNQHPQELMSQTVEISLRIPSLRVRREGKEGLETIDNSDVRFTKHIEVESIPKPGTVLAMTVSNGNSFQCEVVRSDWHHDKNMLVVACKYAKRSVTPTEYQAFMESSDWHVRPLL